MPNVVFEKIELYNFKSYRGPHEIPLDRDPGLYFIDGRNEVNPDLGSNGSGKSTLEDSLLFALTGKTARGLRASNLRSWGEDGPAEAALYIDVDGQPHVIHRSWNPNFLLIDDEQSEQQELDDLIGLVPDELQHTLAISQTASLFFDLRPAEKLKLFSNALNLDVWLELSDNAKSMVQGFSDDIAYLTNEISNLESVIGTYENQAKEYLEEAEAFEEQRDKRIESKEDEIEELQAELSSISSKKKQAERELKRQAKKVSEYDKKLEPLEESYSELQDELSSLSEQKGQISARLSDAEEALEEYENDLDPGGRCSLCGQKVSEAHFKKEVKKIKDKIEHQNKKLDEVETKIYDLYSEKEDIQGEVQEIQETLENAKRKERREDMSLMSIGQKEDTLGSDIERMEEEIVTISKEDNPYDEMAESTIEKKKNKSKELKKHKKDLFEKEATRNSYEYWIQGFKDIRLAVVENALTELEIETNNHLTQLGLLDWIVKYDVEKETKSGGVSKGFNVFIQSPENDDYVPWEAWSGGETQRLRMAGAFGLSSLIQDRKGVSTNIEFIDEKTNGLGGSGVNDLIERLVDRAESMDKAIYLIDHRSHDLGQFNGVLTVVKDLDGSHIEE